MSEKILRQFKKLEETQPSREWLSLTRANLVNKVKFDTLSQKTDWVYNFRLIWFAWRQNFSIVSNKVYALLILIVLIGGTGMAAEAEYIPTKALYKVKETIEKVELVLAMSAESEAKIYLKHAQKRMDEVLKIAQNKDYSDFDKEKNINTVVTKLKKDLNSASVNLDIVKQDDQNQAVTKDLAKELTKNVKDTVAVLNKVAKETDTKTMNETVAKAIVSTEDVDDSAVKLLVAKNSTDKSDNQSDLTDAEKKTLVQDKIDRIEQKLEKVKENLNLYYANQKAKESKGSIITILDKATSLPVILTDDQVKEIEDKIKDAEQSATEAKEKLSANSLTESLNKSKEGNKLINEADEIINQANNINDDQKDNDGSPTSTEKVIDQSGDKKDQDKVEGNTTSTPAVNNK
jgi:hypothetical protein